MKLSKEHIERLREMLARPGQRIVVVSHTNPDGDAVGSSLAWAEVLRTMGHAVTCVVPNKYPYFLDWMPGIDEVVIFKTDTEGRARRAIAEADMIFCLDFNAVSRLEILSDTIYCKETAAADRAQANTARITPPARAYYVGVDLADGKDYTATARGLVENG